MSDVVLNYLHRLTFIYMKNHLSYLSYKEVMEPIPTAGQGLFMQKASGCKCCGWKGKVHETRKNYIFLNTISEIELFCPQCTTYLGFITDEK